MGDGGGAVKMHGADMIKSLRCAVIHILALVSSFTYTCSPVPRPNFHMHPVTLLKIQPFTKKMYENLGLVLSHQSDCSCVAVCMCVCYVSN